MRSTLGLALLTLTLGLAPAAARADGSAAQDLAGSSSNLAECTATCIGAAPVSCQATSCSAQDSTCSTPGWVECNGQRTYCGHNPQPSVSLSCVDLFRKIDCTASVSGGTGNYSYSWSYQGPASYFTSNGNKALAHFPPTGCTGANSFSVTVDDTCGSDSDSENVYCSGW